MHQRNFDHVIFDLDSTLVTIEGIDELARAKGVWDKVHALTYRAMNGEMPFAEVFFQRLTIIQPTNQDLVDLGTLYSHRLTPGATEVVARLTQRARVFLLTGGLNPAVSIVGKTLGIPQTNIFANVLDKRAVVRNLRNTFPGRFVLVGDGMTDWEAGQLTDRFICFTGVAKRKEVIAKSATCARSLHEILSILIEA